MSFPLSWLTDTSGFVPRWVCGEWSAGLGWLHILSDLAIWLAYLAIPVVLVAFVRRRRDVPFPRVFWLFGLFIVSCGTTHLLGAVLFYWPAYRLDGVVKLVTAAASWATVAALVSTLPLALALRTPAALEAEVARRTAELAAAVAALRQEADERSRAERELAEQREWFRVVLASIGDAVVACDDRHRVAFLNPAAEALTGWPAAEAVGRPLGEVVRTFDETTRAPLDGPAARVLREGRAVGLVNHALLATRGGGERVIERSATPIRTADGPPRGVVLAIRDATDRRAAELGRARLAAIVEGTDDAIIGAELDGTIRSWNPGAERLYGWAGAEVVGRPAALLVPADKADELAAVMGRVRTGERVPPYDTVRLTRDGRRVDVSITLSPVLGVGGVPVGYSKIARDIGPRMRAEQARRASEERARHGEALLSAVMDALPVSVFVADPGGRLVRMNPASRTIWGPAPMSADVAGYREYVGYWPGTGRRVEPHEWPLARAVLGGETAAAVRVEIEHFGDRARRHVELSAAPVVGDDGARLGGVVVCQDVTERVAAEDALRESEGRFRAMADIAPVLIWVAGPDKGCTYFNQTWLDFTGRAVADEVGDGWAAGVHPEDLDRCLAVYTAAFDAREPFEMEYRLRRHDGVYRWVLDRARPRTGPGGSLLGYIGSVVDIDDRRTAEARLRASEERIRLALDAARMGVWEWDVRSGAVAWSDECYRTLGVTDFELTLAGFQALVHPDDLGRMMAAVEAAVAAGSTYAAEFRIVRPDGRVRWVANVGYTEYDAGRRPLRVVGTVQDITDRREAEHELRLRERAIRAASQGLLITDPTRPDNPIVYASPGFERMTGYPAAEVVGRNCRFLRGRKTDPAVVAALQEAVDAGREWAGELLNYRKDGSTFWNALSVTPVREGDRITHFVGVQTDVTERRKLEDQLRQSQKMEAVGQLAGGVAHDFNNLLTVINGYSELLLDALPADDPRRPPLAAVREAGERATGLTSQLLTFSRRAVLEPKVVDPNGLVHETGKMLRRLIGEDVSLALALDPLAGRVRVDPGQFGQVLMNLAVNARDAMPTGGRLTVETRDIDLPPDHPDLPPHARPGRYVRTAVSDTGTGMPPEVKGRIFEPFFTTKGPGQGTGLGLATVYGIVTQSGGHVEVDSEVGVGTTFRVYLPAVGESGAAVQEVDRGAVRGGSETVLLVEDQEDVRTLARAALEVHGYAVLEAADGPAALRRLAGRPAVHLLVTDVVMPGMSGRQVAEAVGGLYPGLPVLFVSGYTDDAVVRHGILQAEVAFLRKPYTPLSLARKVREVLDAAG